MQEEEHREQQIKLNKLIMKQQLLSLKQEREKTLQIKKEKVKTERLINEQLLKNSLLNKQMKAKLINESVKNDKKKIEDNNNKEIIDNILFNNGQQEHNHSSLKNDKFKGLTSEQIIKKYEDVINSREKQYHELSKEIKKLNNTIKILKEKKEKSKINNDKLKEVFSVFHFSLRHPFFLLLIFVKSF